MEQLPIADTSIRCSKCDSSVRLEEEGMILYFFRCLNQKCRRRFAKPKNDWLKVKGGIEEPAGSDEEG